MPEVQEEQQSPQVVLYWAVSILQSRTFWINIAAFAVAVLSEREVLVVIPLRYMPLYSAALAILNIFMRMQTVRPVALIGPGEVKPVEVPRVGPPAPAEITS
jgi:hypothetical protein